MYDNLVRVIGIISTICMIMSNSNKSFNPVNPITIKKKPLSIHDLIWNHCVTI
ncbi:hypothetical protein PIROE2DRAFT_6714 [Piromyces sp. E2]|nr:hypothetical protein PIROE2DRAFT_6714 [Piromyces sp. E2]|eukprot:OUM66182.1 hypothetical protein PIROE2DRAFT_6714 [Piromyces sp. E2]